jgi:hypothetical protein
MRISQRALVVVRKGRPRKPGYRHPCGQLIDPSKAEVTEAEKALAKVIAIRQPHRQSVPESLRHDAKAENVLGRLQLGGKITKDEYDAGKWWAVTVRRYLQSIEGPSPNPSSIAGVGTGGGRAHIDEDEAIRRKSVYDQGIFVLFEKGQKFAKATNQTAVYDRTPDARQLFYLQEGLHALSIHKGLTKDEKRCTKIKTGAM